MLSSLSVLVSPLLHSLEMAAIRRIGNDTKLDRILNRDFVFNMRSGYVEVGEDNVCLPVYYEEYEEKIRKFDVHDDDVYVIAHPKSGTNWTEEMVWLIGNNLDYAGAAKLPTFARFPQLELNAMFDYGNAHKFIDVNTFKSIETVGADFMLNPFSCIVQSKRPRYIKSHLHWSLLPEQIRNGTKQPKIISVLRNAADVCVSLYYHSQTYECYKGTFEDFCELFVAGRVCFGPFWKLILSHWNQRDRSNILFLTFKEMKDDLPAVIRKVSQFLEKSLTEDQVAKLAQHLSFDSMKTNSSTNHDTIAKDVAKTGHSTAQNQFIRSGKVGGYKAEMSPELIARFEAWSKENLVGTRLPME